MANNKVQRAAKLAAAAALWAVPVVAGDDLYTMTVTSWMDWDSCNAACTPATQVFTYPGNTVVVEPTILPISECEVCEIVPVESTLTKVYTKTKPLPPVSSTVSVNTTLSKTTYSKTTYSKSTYTKPTSTKSSSTTKSTTSSKTTSSKSTSTHSSYTKPPMNTTTTTSTSTTYSHSKTKSSSITTSSTSSAPTHTPTHTVGSGASQCGNNQVISCCNSGNSNSEGSLAGSIIDGLSGGNCSPLDLGIIDLGTPLNSACTGQVACCSGDQNGLINIACSNIGGL